MTIARPTDLFVVGLGIGGARRLTWEATDVLARASRVLHLSPLHDELCRLVKNGSVESLNDIYRSDSGRLRVYDAIAARVLEVALECRESGAHVVWATYGHPRWLVRSTETILALSDESHLSVCLVPGISSFDTILMDAPWSFGPGATLVEANDFVKRDLVVDTRLPLVVFQFGDAGTEDLRPELGDVARFEPLIVRLEGIYPPTHAVSVIVSSWQRGVPSRVTTGTIASLREIARFAHVGTTLVVPPDLHAERLGNR